MNLNVNSVSRGQTNPNFGMAVKLDSDAHPIIKKQVSKLSAKKAEKFWEDFDKIVEDQKDNLVNIIIRKCNNRRALAAEVVDNSESALENKVFTQGLIHPSGLKFVKSAEDYANKVNVLNQKLAGYEKAVDTDYTPNIGSVDLEA